MAGRIYVDYAATTPVDPRVVREMEPYFTGIFGNPNSINSYGLDAHRVLEEARVKVAGLMNAEPGEVVFTGSATEANNMALKGHAFYRGRERAHIAVSTVEHECVLESARWLERLGFKVTYLPVDEYGLLDLERLKEALEEGATMVSVIHGNNEVGTVQRMDDIVRLCHKHGAVIHTDAVQSFGKVPLDVKSMGVDMVTVNGHKLYGPKGVGALYIRSGVEIEPLLHGGGQEFGLRSGTQNVSGIVGFAKAVELRGEEMGEEAERLVKMRDRLIEGIQGVGGGKLNGHPEERLPNNVSFRFPYIEGEALVTQLDMEGVAASTGSACASRSGEASHVLLALGIDPVEARGSLRISLGKYNTDEDVDYILEVLPKVVKRLQDISPLRPRSS